MWLTQLIHFPFDTFVINEPSLDRRYATEMPDLLLTATLTTSSAVLFSS